jgi:hypothetical protein
MLLATTIPTLRTQAAGLLAAPVTIGADNSLLKRIPPEMTGSLQIPKVRDASRIGNNFQTPCRRSRLNFQIDVMGLMRCRRLVPQLLTLEPDMARKSSCNKQERPQGNEKADH